MAQNEAPKTLPSEPGDPIPGIRRIYDHQRGIGFMVCPPMAVLSAAAVTQCIGFFLKRLDNGALGKPFMPDLVMN